MCAHARAHVCHVNTDAHEARKGPTSPVDVSVGTGLRCLNPLSISPGPECNNRLEPLPTEVSPFSRVPYSPFSFFLYFFDSAKNGTQGLAHSSHTQYVNTVGEHSIAESWPLPFMINYFYKNNYI